jgi:SAM-dependent methyltransferase
LRLPYHGDGRLLDFGCGSGWYAERMRRRGWKVTAMDASVHAARQAAKSFGLPTLVGTLPHPDVAPNSFDVITMGAVFEHVHWPHDVIAGAREALAPGGLLAIAVPNLASWGFAYFGADWDSLDLPRHLLHFTPTTLRRLVEMHGFQVREIRMLGRGGSLRLSFAKARAGGRPARHWLELLGRWRFVVSALNRWTVWNARAESFLLIATRPSPASGHVEVAAA